jgi:chemotaxis-related protein WspB
MLGLVFAIDGRSYAIDAAAVVQVAPFVELRPLPRAPSYVRGVVDRHGQAVPVVDVSMLLAERAAPERLDTRLALVRLGERGDSPILGLLLEGVRGTARIDEGAFVDVRVPLREAPWLDGIAQDDGQLIQRVVVERLLPPDLLMSMLRDEEAG